MARKKLGIPVNPDIIISFNDLVKIKTIVDTAINNYYASEDASPKSNKKKEVNKKSTKTDTMNQISKDIRTTTVNKGSSVTLFVNSLMEREILGRVEDVITDIVDVGEVDREDTLVNLGISSTDLDVFVCGLQDNLDIYVSEDTFDIIERESHNLNIGDIVKILYNIRNY